MIKSLLSLTWSVWKKIMITLNQAVTVAIFAIIYLAVVGVYRFLSFSSWQPSTKKYPSSFWHDKKHQPPTLQNLEKPF